MRHGDATADFSLAVWLGPDPELALVHADMNVWLAAHPCICTDEAAAYPPAGVTCPQCGPGCECGIEAQEREDFVHGGDCPLWEETS